MATKHLKTLEETFPLLSEGKVYKFYIVKKGSKYLTFKNNELAMTNNQTKAVLFDNEKQIHSFIQNAIIDDRNARVIGRSYSHTTMTVTKPIKE